MTETTPWHRGLTRESVARQALRLLDAGGRAALTMRKLAASLDVKAASLYAHVRDKDDLLDAVLDAVLDTIELPDLSGDPGAELAAGFAGYRRALVAHPEIIRVMTERSRVSGAQIRLVERSLELFERAGLSSDAAAQAHVTVVSYVIGFVWQEVSRPTQPPPELLEAPRTRRALALVATQPADERFLDGLNMVLHRALGRS